MMDFLNRIGHDNFVWWLGVVEDRQDPLKMGRCRVRIFGAHNPVLDLVPTDSLPWAQPMIPVNGSLSTGTPQEGDYVFGFFLDGLSSQLPCIIGIFPGIPQENANNSKGFTDQRNKESLEKSPKKPVISGASWSEGKASLNPTILGEPTTSRISRNDKIEETLIAYRKENLDKDVPTSTGATWNEPATEYDAVPPFDRVFESESGHILEFDDTPNKERVNITHRKGSFIEFHPDGSKVTKIIGDNYEIFLKDNNIHVKGECNITVDGDANLYVKGDVNEKVDGNVNSSVGGDITASIGGSVFQTADEETQITSPTIKLNGDTIITGTLYVTDQINSEADIIAGSGVSLENHVHSAVKSGPDTSGPPVS